MNCSKCGTLNNVDSKFCMNCGQSLENSQVNIGQPINYQQVQQPVQPQVNPEIYQQPISNINNNTNVTPKKNKTIKIILILAALLLVVVISVFFVFKFFFKNDETVNLNAIFDPDRPIIIKENGKYGYITSEGKLMLEPQYNEATDFYGEYAVVKVDNPKKDAYRKEISQIIDKKGNVKLTSEGYYDIKYYSEYNLWIVDETLYDSKFNQVLAEGTTVDYISNGYFKYTDNIKNESGIINYKCKKIFTIPGKSISVSISDNEYDKDELYATVKTYENQKEVIISLKTGDILFTLEDAENYYISVQDDGIFYYYNQNDDNGYENKKYLFFVNNKLAYETTEKVDEVDIEDYENQILEIDYGYDYEELGKSQSIYYYDVKSKKMLKEKPSTLKSEDELEIELLEKNYGIKEYSKAGSYGLIAKDKIVVPCEYDDVDYLNIGLFNYMKSKGKKIIILEKDGSIILYNLKNSKAITTFETSYIYDYEDSTFIKIPIYGEGGYRPNKYIAYNLLSGQSMTFEKESDFTINSNYVVVKKDDKNIYYNTDFKQIYMTDKN